MNSELKNRPQVFVFNSKVGVGEIKESTKDGKPWWYYTTQETTPYATHRVIYNSTSIEALTKHRNNYIDELKEREKLLNRGSSSEGIQIKTTLFQWLFCKNKGKNK